MEKSETIEKLTSIPGMPRLTHVLKELSFVILGNSDQLVLERNHTMKVTDTEAFFVYLGEYNIGRYVIAREYDMVERRFLCIVPMDFPITDFPLKHMNLNLTMTVTQDQIRIGIELLIVRIDNFLNKVIDIINLVSIPPKEVNKLINNAIVKGKLAENEMKLMKKLLIPGFHPNVASMTDVYGDKISTSFGVVTYHDRKGKIHVNFAVMASRTYEFQFIVWATEKLVYWARRKIAHPWWDKFCVVVLGSMGALSNPFTRNNIIIIILLFTIHNGLNMALIFIPFLCIEMIYNFLWRYHAKKILICIFESIGGDIKEVRRRLALEKMFGNSPKKHKKDNDQETMINR